MNASKNAGVKRLVLHPCLLVGLVLGAVGCQKQAESAQGTVSPPSPKTIRAELSAGTRVPVMLAKQLESGIDDANSQIPMIVTEDVKDGAGHLLISKGTPLQGHVTWSRREGTLGSLMNRPARLNLQFDTTVAVDGTAVNLCSNPKQPEEDYELNRGNTGFSNAARSLETVNLDSRDETILASMQELFENGDAGALESAEARIRLQNLAQKLNLPGLQTLAQQNDVGKVRGLLDRLRKGNSLARLAPVALDGPLTLSALMEMAQIAGKVNDRLNKATHGRNIKAYIGTPLVAFVKTSVTVKTGG